MLCKLEMLPDGALLLRYVYRRSRQSPIVEIEDVAVDFIFPPLQVVVSVAGGHPVEARSIAGFHFEDGRTVRGAVSAHGVDNGCIEVEMAGRRIGYFQWRGGLFGCLRGLHQQKGRRGPIEGFVGDKAVRPPAMTSCLPVACAMGRQLALIRSVCRRRGSWS